MSINRETSISRQPDPAEGKKFLKFLTDLAPVGPRTVGKYVAVVKPLLVNGEMFTFDDAARYIKRKNRVYVRAAILKYIDYMEHQGQMTEEEVAIWRKKLPKVRELPAKPRELAGLDDIKKIFELMDKPDRMIGRFTFFTGCRISEALSVKLKDINFKTGMVVLYGKGHLEKKPRPVKIPVAFAKALEAHAKDLGLLAGETIFWPNSKASIKSKVDIFDRKFRKACIEVLGRSLGSHDLRRVVATKLLQDTDDIQLVQTILGHEKLETTQRYTKYVDKERYMNRARDIMSNVVGE